MLEELAAVEECVCCKGLDLQLPPHTFAKQLVRVFGEGLVVFLGVHVKAQTSDLGNVACV